MSKSPPKDINLKRQQSVIEILRNSIKEKILKLRKEEKGKSLRNGVIDILIN